MREIKFRAFSSEDEKMYYGRKVELIHTEELFYCRISLDRSIDRPFSEYDISAKLMQFTGLIDKNGKEIYEGDYLADLYPVNEEDLSLGYNESLLPVVWCKDKLMWCVDVSFKKDGSYLTSMVEYFGDFLEVKGNVFETQIK